jgi:hypothetical protein
MKEIREIEKEYFRLEKLVMYADTFAKKEVLKKELWAKFDELQTARYNRTK